MLFAHCCATLSAVQNAYRPSNTSSHTLPVFLDQHTASPIRMFMASSHNLNRMSESWFHLLPSSFLFAFIPTSSYSFFLTLQLFSGEYFLCFSHSLFDQSVLIFHLVEGGMWCLSPTLWTFTFSKTSLTLASKGVYVNVCMCVCCVLGPSTLFSTSVLQLNTPSGNVYTVWFSTSCLCV